MHSAWGWALLLLVVQIYVFLAPFTKVEESFNVQAVHDILYHGADVASYDHVQFPGVVPRTFLGALALAAATAPFRAAAALLGMRKLYVQVAARLLLGAGSVASMAALQRSVDGRFGPATGAALMLLTALQFHLPFYFSRPLPNVMALGLTNLGLAAWLAPQRRPYRAIALLTVAAVVFRCDAILLAGLVGLHLLATRQVTLLHGAAVGALTALAALAVTVPIDSWLWRRWVWPEGQVLWFNTALNKSSEWGVSPPLWYFTSALPRALHAAYPLAVLGAAVDRRARPVLAVALGFVALYSNLGHKELRFLLPVLPLWNIAAAAGLAHLWRSRRASAARGLAFAAAAAMLAAGVATVALAVQASVANYPGGHALLQLHRLGAQRAQQALAAGRTVTVHIGVLPAMTGVSRFLEEGRPWVYSKEEGLTPAQLRKAGFDYLITDAAEVAGYRSVGAMPGFAGMRLRGGSLPAALRALLRSGQLPVELKLATAVHILGRK